MVTDTDELRLLTTLLERVNHLVSEQLEHKDAQRETNRLLREACDRVAEVEGALTAHVQVTAERWSSHKEVHARERTALGVLSAVFSALAGGIASWFG